MPSTLLGINTMYVIAGAAVVLLLIIILASSSGKKRRQAEEEAASAASAPIAFIPSPEPTTAPAPVSGLSAKTVAAIMAAVSAASGTPIQHLRFTAIRRVNGIQGQWANSGTAEIIATRQTYL